MPATRKNLVAAVCETSATCAQYEVGKPATANLPMVNRVEYGFRPPKHPRSVLALLKVQAITQRCYYCQIN